MVNQKSSRRGTRWHGERQSSNSAQATGRLFSMAGRKRSKELNKFQRFKNSENLKANLISSLWHWIVGFEMISLLVWASFLRLFILKWYDFQKRMLSNGIHKSTSELRCSTSSPVESTGNGHILSLHRVTSSIERKNTFCEYSKKILVYAWLAIKVLSSACKPVLGATNEWNPEQFVPRFGRNLVSSLGLSMKHHQFTCKTYPAREMRSPSIGSFFRTPTSSHHGSQAG